MRHVNDILRSMMKDLFNLTEKEKRERSCAARDKAMKQIREILREGI